MIRAKLLGLAILALVLAACAPDGAGGVPAGADPDAGPPVTDRSFETFDGKQTTLREFEGQPVVVNFWASWCPPCIAEMPEFEQVHLSRQQDVRFLGLNTQDDHARAQTLVEQTDVTYDLALDPDGELFRDFEVIAMPSTYLVNAAGAVVHRHAGILSQEQLQDLIDEHLVARPVDS